MSDEDHEIKPFTQKLRDQAKGTGMSVSINLNKAATEIEDLQAELTRLKKTYVEIPPELRGASLTIIGHPMMIEQVRQNHVLKTKLSRWEKALQHYADKSNWCDEGKKQCHWSGGDHIDGYEIAQQALDDMEKSDQ